MDKLGSRYGLLPSEVLERGTTLDLMVLDIALSYENYKQNRAQGEAPNISEDVMLEALKKVRGT